MMEIMNWETVDGPLGQNNIEIVGIVILLNIKEKLTV